MTKAAQDLSIEWLREQLVLLLGKASLGEEPDHQACAQYAALLFKMLPSSGGKAQNADIVQKAQQALERERRQAIEP